MKFQQFIKIYQEVPFIDSSTFSFYTDKPQDLRRQVREWVKKSYLIPLKKGIYVFHEPYKKKNLSPLFLSNYLVLPSYLSLEYAMGFYELIPEKVTVFTSVTTKKTKSFGNFFGEFEYRSIKKNLFFGFRKETDNHQEFFIASPEKALLDYFYFNSHYQKNFQELESLRLQNTEKLNLKLLKNYGKKFNERVKRIVMNLTKFVQQEEKRYKSL